MAHWELKIEKQFADEIVSGMKNFEIRCESDKVFQKGDSVEFRVNPVELFAAGEPGAYYVTKEDHPINGRIYDITYVLHGWGLREDYCAFSIKETDKKPPEPKESMIPSREVVRKFGDELKRNVVRDIRKMCTERPICTGCIFNNEDIHENKCMLKGIPGDWKI